MIPHIVHYCWFGRTKKPKNIQRYIDKWHQMLPDYQIIEWNEDNFPVDYCSYTKEAYEMKKYAFVSDVARLYALVQYGGVYLDTDVEILKRFDQYIDEATVVLSKESNSLLMTAFMATEKHNKIFEDLLEAYKTRRFKNTDGTLNCVANTVYLTEYMEKMGLSFDVTPQYLDENVVVYDWKVFGAFNADESQFKITDSTILVHYCRASWGTPMFRLQLTLKKNLAFLLGGGYNKIRRLLKKLKN